MNSVMVQISTQVVSCDCFSPIESNTTTTTNNNNDNSTYNHTCSGPWGPSS